MRSDTLKMPEAEKNGFVKTLNNMGYMTSSLDPFSKEFVGFTSKAPGPALDIGAAYGIATIEALKTGAEVYANDIDERHLEILKSRTPSEQHSRLKLIPGAFPNDINLPNESVGAVLVCRVLHFFDGPGIIRAAEKILSS